MLKVSTAVAQILSESEIELEALKKGIVNLRAYAQLIKSDVEERTMKSVQIGSIVVALSRIQKKSQTYADIHPHIRLEDITVKSPLCEISYEKTVETGKKLASLQRSVLVKPTDFSTMTSGVSEITIIIAQEHALKIQQAFESEPTCVLYDLVGVSVRFDPSYIDIANSLYSLMYQLACKRINILEIVSTYTELTFILRQPDLPLALNVLGKLLGKKTVIQSK